jgi:hypothetical protein
LALQNKALFTLLGSERANLLFAARKLPFEDMLHSTEQGVSPQYFIPLLHPIEHELHCQLQYIHSRIALSLSQTQFSTKHVHHTEHTLTSSSSTTPHLQQLAVYHDFFSNVCMSCTPPSACAAPLRHSILMTPEYSIVRTSAMLLAPTSCQQTNESDRGDKGTQERTQPCQQGTQRVLRLSTGFPYIVLSLSTQVGACAIISFTSSHPDSTEHQSTRALEHQSTSKGLGFRV